MELSAAIRIGSMTTHQIVAKLDDGKGGRCAIGAALDACGLPLRHDAATVAWPLLGALYEAGGDVFTELVHRNDHLHHTREQIADWVETIEAQYEAANAPTEKVVQEVAL